MYLRSASVGAQAEAILTASASWGIGPAGREEIPFPVCKRKYQPTRTEISDIHGDILVPLYGCHYHSHIRAKRIKRGVVFVCTVPASALAGKVLQRGIASTRNLDPELTSQLPLSVRAEEIQ
eukprot:gene713-1176_t